jgi:hypothetical protein
VRLAVTRRVVKLVRWGNPLLMASNPSFDISTGADLQEVDNAVKQALK